MFYIISVLHCNDSWIFASAGSGSKGRAIAFPSSIPKLYFSELVLVVRVRQWLPTSLGGAICPHCRTINDTRFSSPWRDRIWRSGIWTVILLACTVEAKDRHWVTCCGPTMWASHTTAHWLRRSSWESLTTIGCSNSFQFLFWDSRQFLCLGCKIFKIEIYFCYPSFSSSSSSAAFKNSSISFT